MTDNDRELIRMAHGMDETDPYEKLIRACDTEEARTTIKLIMLRKHIRDEQR